MKHFVYSLIFILFLSTHSFGAVYELGVTGGQNFFTRDGDQSKDENYTRFTLFGGYQFHQTSDQMLLSLKSDKYVDEVDFSYLLALPWIRKYTPFRAMPFVKATIGTGNTYADNLTLTHISYGASIGAHALLTTKIRIRFEIEHKERKWQLDRSGNEPDISPTTFNDKELGFYIGFGYLF